MYEQIDFHFRYQPGSASPYAVLLKYLQPKKKANKQNGEPVIDNDLGEFPRERMILWALSAFWYPSACKALGKFNKAQLKQKARNAIYQLLQQVYYLIQLFELDPQEFVLPELGSKVKDADLTTEMVVDEAKASMSSTISTASNSKSEEKLEPLTSTLLLIRNENDEELDEAFDG